MTTLRRRVFSFRIAFFVGVVFLATGSFIAAFIQEDKAQLNDLNNSIRADKAKFDALYNEVWSSVPNPKNPSLMISKQINFSRDKVTALKSMLKYLDVQLAKQSILAKKMNLSDKERTGFPAGVNRSIRAQVASSQIKDDSGSLASASISTPNSTSKPALAAPLTPPPMPISVPVAKPTPIVASAVISAPASVSVPTSSSTLQSLSASTELSGPTDADLQSVRNESKKLKEECKRLRKEADRLTELLAQETRKKSISDEAKGKLQACDLEKSKLIKKVAKAEAERENLLTMLMQAIEQLRALMNRVKQGETLTVKAVMAAAPLAVTPIGIIPEVVKPASVPSATSKPVVKKAPAQKKAKKRAKKKTKKTLKKASKKKMSKKFAKRASRARGKKRAKKKITPKKRI